MSNELRVDNLGFCVYEDETHVNKRADKRHLGGFCYECVDFF